MFRKASFYQKMYTIIIMIGYVYLLQYWIRLFNQRSIPTLYEQLHQPRSTRKPAKPAVTRQAVARKAVRPSRPVSEPAEAEILIKETIPAAEKLEKAAKDDLKMIEGIGPKTEKTLFSAGITTYAHLASRDAEALRQILKAAGINANPDTWSEQAKLASDAQWEELKNLQSQLKGGLKS